MASPFEIVEVARSYIGTPFHHQGRVKGVGVDCIGLITGVAQELNIFQHDRTDYERYIKDENILLDELRKVFMEISVDEIETGDVVVFWVDKSTKIAQHVGIKTDDGIIHTHNGVRKVVETCMNFKWKERITHAFRYPPGEPEWQA